MTSAETESPLNPAAPNRAPKMIESTVTSLFRYQPFKLDRLHTIIVKSKISLSSPSLFNDPWDCRIWYDPDMDKPGRIDSAIDFYVTSTRNQRKDIPEDEIQRRVAYFRKNPQVLSDGVKKISEAMQKDIFDRYRVCCFSARPDSELMWAHYSDSHRGVCLEFDSTNAFFQNAYKVTYLESYPVLDIGDHRELEELTYVLTKSEAWKYEGEYRLISLESDSKLSVSTLDIPTNSLKSVIVGYSADQKTWEGVRALIAESGRKIALKRAVPARDRYTVEIHEN